MANPQDKEKYLDLKERHYRAFLTKVNKSNGRDATFPIASFTPYKYYVGRGNNSMQVRACLKNRFWWSMGDYDEWSDYNFTWTQWKSNKIIEGLKTHKETQQESDHHHKAIEASMASTHNTDNHSGSSTENLLITTPKRQLNNKNQPPAPAVQASSSSTQKEKTPMV